MLVVLNIDQIEVKEKQKKNKKKSPEYPLFIVS